MSKKLIGLAGKAGAGKDTVADYLWEKEEAIKIAFADALRAAACSIFGLGSCNFTDRDLKEAEVEYWGMSPRRWFLSYSAVRDTDHVVVPDVRFDVEAEALRSLGGRIIHIVRPGFGLGGDSAAHVSEAGIEPGDGDFYLLNDGTVHDLYHKVDQIWEAIK